MTNSPEDGASPDCERYSFRPSGPWVVEPERLLWRDGVDALREQTRRELPDLVRRRRLPPLVRFAEAGALVGLAVARWAVGARRRGGSASRSDLSRRLRIAFEHLGPTYIKLGQIVSSGKGLFPEELVEEFKRCRDQVAPEPFENVRRVVEEELGQRLEDAFQSFERECLASASIAQVHAAVLRGGESVVVKVQRTTVATRVRRDIRAMAWIAPFLVGRLPVAALANPPALVDLFAETITEELDFRLEAQNMLDVAEVLRAAGQEAVVVPRPHPELVKRRVLVMERLEGFDYEDVEGMRSAGIDTAEVLRGLLISFLEGAMIYGVFHGDLHGGNLFVTPHGKIALLDYGITGRMNDKQRLAFLRMMMSGIVGDLRGQLAAFRDLGALPEDADLEEVARLLRLDEPTLDPTSLTGEELVAEIQRVLKGLLAQGARLPKHLMLYVKDLLFIDSAIATLAPDTDLFVEVARIYAYFAQNHADQIHREAGFDPRNLGIDFDGLKRSMGLENETATLTHREIQERREVIQERVEKAGGVPPRG